LHECCTWSLLRERHRFGGVKDSSITYWEKLAKKGYIIFRYCYVDEKEEGRDEEK
jgi:hypothetical protein